MNKKIIIGAAIVVVAAVSFGAGSFWQQRSIFSNRPFFQSGGGPGDRGPQGNRFGGPQIGERMRERGAPVISGRLDRVSDDVISITTISGSVKIKLDDKTKISIAETAGKEGLKEGKQVVIEAEPSDGDGLTAKSVIMR